MTRLSIILVFFFYSFSAIGQQVLIRDIKTKKDLEFVTIYSQQLNKLEISDEHGVADISEFEGADYLEFRLYGYKTETISLQKLQADGFEVFLSPSMVFFATSGSVSY
jgi:hemoglobin/transferrin/lactoferrin receptor protein